MLFIFSGDRFYEDINMLLIQYMFHCFIDCHLLNPGDFERLHFNRVLQQQ